MSRLSSELDQFSLRSYPYQIYIDPSTPLPPMFIAFSQNYLDAPIPENSWSCKPFCCRCPYEEKKSDTEYIPCSRQAPELSKLISPRQTLTGQMVEKKNYCVGAKGPRCSTADIVNPSRWEEMMVIDQFCFSYYKSSNLCYSYSIVILSVTFLSQGCINDTLINWLDREYYSHKSDFFSPNRTNLLQRVPLQICKKVFQYSRSHWCLPSPIPKLTWKWP